MVVLGKVVLGMVVLGSVGAMFGKGEKGFLKNPDQQPWCDLGA
jgi:hypothetical protein